jgi:hypothetical protein
VGEMEEAGCIEDRVGGKWREGERKSCSYEPIKFCVQCSVLLMSSAINVEVAESGT